MVAILTLCLYVALTHPPISKPLPPDLAWGNYYGRSSLLVMPVALTSTTLLSEAMWQRCVGGEGRGVERRGGEGG